MTGERPHARAVFSPDDFALLKEALGDFISRLKDDDTRSIRLAQLYHRLGRVG